ncbi:MAG: type I-E CRISPR-associated endonuclease Cas1e [Lentisphaeria bacterium]|nr:type I-E CRISPR-associated endonuclease Cas1e [Lentisphaeria bacterium]
MANRIIIKASLADLPKIRDRYPFVYLEHGRLEIDDSSVKWISAEREYFRLPAALFGCILLGPGTTVTHEAVKVLATLNTSICWVGEDSLNFYAVGQTPTASSYNLKKQVALAADQEKALAVARNMFSMRFGNVDVSQKSLTELMSMEGRRVQKTYSDLANKYFVQWGGRAYTPGKFNLSDLTNKLITAGNAALYALVSAVIHALGLSPRIGFVHSGSPLPFVYDIADLYKEELVFDMAFELTAKMAGVYNRYTAIDEFKNRVINAKFMERCPADIIKLLRLKS